MNFRLGSVTLTDNCKSPVESPRTHGASPVICVYADEVAEVLRCPPPNCYMTRSIVFVFYGLPLPSSFFLCTPSVDVQLQRIRWLPSDGYPVLKARSRTKTSLPRP